MSGARELQVNVGPATWRWFPSTATALNCCVRLRATSVADAGLTTTDRTICDTDSVVVPDTAPVVAVIVVTPFATAVARPVAGSIVATPVGAADQVKTCPGTAFPFPSCATALNCCMRPSASSVALAGLTPTDLTICATDIAAAPDTPAVVAVIVALPFPTALTTPPASTEATRGLSDFHVNDRPGMTLPLASFAVAVNCCVSPRASSAAVAGLTTTDPTACAIDSVALPETPAVAAVMSADPIASPVARPFWSTLAMAGADEVQVKACPATGFPFPSCATAVNCWVRPRALSVAEVGFTTTALTI